MSIIINNNNNNNSSIIINHLWALGILCCICFYKIMIFLSVWNAIQILLAIIMLLETHELWDLWVDQLQSESQIACCCRNRLKFIMKIWLIFSVFWAISISSSTAKPRKNSFWENKISQRSAWNTGVGAQSKVSVWTSQCGGFCSCTQSSSQL